MPQFRLNRRAVLRGAGVAIALPWLEIMTPERTASAATRPAKRFLAVFTPGGTVLENWRPSGGELDFVLSPILKPLENVRSTINVMDGIDMPSAVGEQNQAGLIAWLTGTKQNLSGGGASFAQGPSIDQVLASRLSPGYQLRSLQLAIRWGTGKSRGKPSPINIANFADSPQLEPIVPSIDPVEVWKQLFGGAEVAPSKERDWDKSILDHVGKRYERLAARLGKDDRARLESHLTKIREIELRLAPGPGPSCTPPSLVDTSDYDPAAGLRSDDAGAVEEPETDAAIPKVGKLMMDMMVMALACDITPVGTLQWSDTEAKHRFPWLGLKEHLHFYMNDGGYRPEELTTIFTWYAEQHAYLLEQLRQVQTSEGSLLDETVLFFGSQLQHPATHAKTDMPFLLAGNGGGMRTGRYIQSPHASHNNLLVSLLNLFGDDAKVFGDAQFCSGPLGGLT
jgi:Protein of unknown function (DUF1552)